MCATCVTCSSHTRVCGASIAQLQLSPWPHIAVALNVALGGGGEGASGGGGEGSSGGDGGGLVARQPKVCTGVHMSHQPLRALAQPSSSTTAHQGPPCAMPGTVVQPL